MIYKSIEDIDLTKLLRFIEKKFNQKMNNYFFNNIDIYMDEVILRKLIHNYDIWVFGEFEADYIKDIIFYKLPIFYDKSTFAELEAFPLDNDTLLNKSINEFQRQLNSQNEITKIKIEISDDYNLDSIKSTLKSSCFENELFYMTPNGKKYVYSKIF